MSTEEKVELILDNLLDNNFLIGSAVKKLMSIIEEEKRIKVCTGCSRRSDNKLPATELACCPDSNYIPLDYYLKKSVYRPDLFKD